MPDLSHETHFGRETGKVICGVDEVGRGPLAGPVIAAALIIPPHFPEGLSSAIRDSKKMTAKQREVIFPHLVELCSHAITEASVSEIETLNILHASMLAMRRAIEGLKRTIDVALIDGNRIPQKISCEAHAIVAGDDKSLSIAAASIIAKVTRDRLMQKLAQDFPGYGWERNAGYGTKQHLEALERLGPTKWHRMGFAPIAQLKLREA